MELFFNIFKHIGLWIWIHVSILALISPYVILVIQQYFANKDKKAQKAPVISVGNYHGATKYNSPMLYIGSSQKYISSIYSDSIVKLNIFNSGGTSINKVRVSYKIKNFDFIDVALRSGLVNKPGSGFKVVKIDDTYEVELGDINSDGLKMLLKDEEIFLNSDPIMPSSHNVFSFTLNLEIMLRTIIEALYYDRVHPDYSSNLYHFFNIDVIVDYIDYNQNSHHLVFSKRVGVRLSNANTVSEIVDGAKIQKGKKVHPQIEISVTDDD